jgi:hypothetical protein
MLYTEIGNSIIYTKLIQHVKVVQKPVQAWWLKFQVSNVKSTKNINKMWKENNYQHRPASKEKEQIMQPRSHTVTVAGKVRCRFELFIRWPENANRHINPFTQRGDAFGITEPDKMLKFLMQYFIRKHHQWLFAELYDNTIPLDDPYRIILELKNKTLLNNTVISDVNWTIVELKDKMIRHRLRDYAPLLKDFSIPEWLQIVNTK